RQRSLASTQQILDNVAWRWSRAMTTIAADVATSPAKRLPEHALSPATLTIFGAGGDLTKRLIMPALYNLVRAGKLPDGFAIIGVDHNDETTEEWCQSLAEMMQAFVRAGGQGKALDEQAWSWLPPPTAYNPRAVLG